MIEDHLTGRGAARGDIDEYLARPMTAPERAASEERKREAWDSSPEAIAAAESKFWN